MADVLTDDQIKLLVEGPNPLDDAAGPVKRHFSADEVVIAQFGSVEHFRVIFDAYRDDLFKLAAPERPWAWWALDGPGMDEPPEGLKIVKRRPSPLQPVPPVMVRHTFLGAIK